MSYINTLNLVSSLQENHYLCVKNDILRKKTHYGKVEFLKKTTRIIVGKKDSSAIEISEALRRIEDAFIKTMDEYLLYRNSTSLELAKSALEGIYKMSCVFPVLDGNPKALLVNKTYTFLSGRYEEICNYQDPYLLEELYRKRKLKTSLHQMRALESSVVLKEGNSCQRHEPLHYFLRKLDLFLLLHRHLLSSKQDRILKSMIEVCKHNIATPFYYSSGIGVIGNVEKNSISAIVSQTLEYLDNLNDIEASVGVMRTIGYLGYSSELNEQGDEIFTYQGHQAILGCRKENGNYLLNVYNSGNGGCGEVSQNNPGEGKVVVEYAPISREEAQRQFNESLIIYRQKRSVPDVYKIFEDSFDQLVLVPIKGLPDRPFQRIGNCGIRNLIEWLIFTMQRLDEVDLANKLVFFQVIQDETTYTKPLVKPLGEE